MRRFRICYPLGILLLFLSGAMLISTVWSLPEGGKDFPAFLWSSLLTAGIGLLFYRLFLPYRPEQFSLMESFHW